MSCLYEFRKRSIIAVDGGANRLLSIGVKPDLVIGDLDSINQNLRATLNTIYLPNQDYCNFSKAMTHLKTMKLLPSIITGVTGGAIDHILQNINIFLSTGSIFYTPSPSMVGSVNKILCKPYESPNKIEKTHKNLSSLIKSGKNTPKIFDSTEKTFDQVYKYAYHRISALFDFVLEE